MRLLAEVFLPESQNLQKQLNDLMNLTDSGTGGLGAGLGAGLNPAFKKISKFKKHSLRPGTVSVRFVIDYHRLLFISLFSAKQVKVMCDKFDKTWKGCMQDNTGRWQEIMDAIDSDDQVRVASRINNTKPASKIGSVVGGSKIGSVSHSGKDTLDVKESFVHPATLNSTTNFHQQSEDGITISSKSSTKSRRKSSMRSSEKEFIEAPK